MSSSYGMPSNHTQFMGFFTLYLSLCFLFRFQHKHTNFDLVFKYVSIFGSLSTSMIIAYSRCYLEYHTMSQVIVGQAVGFTFAVLWFTCIHLLVTPYFSQIACSKLGEFFLLRDSSRIPNILWFEYTTSRTEARSRQRKLAKKSK